MAYQSAEGRIQSSLPPHYLRHRRPVSVWSRSQILGRPRWDNLTRRRVVAFGAFGARCHRSVFDNSGGLASEKAGYPFRATVDQSGLARRIGSFEGARIPISTSPTWTRLRRRTAGIRHSQASCSRTDRSNKAWQRCCVDRARTVSAKRSASRRRQSRFAANRRSRYGFVANHYPIWATRCQSN